MKSFAHPRSIQDFYGAASAVASFGRQVAAGNHAMLRTLGWTVVIAGLAFFVWQAASPEPVWPPAVSALLLVVVSLLAGLRISAESARAYMTDLQRLNKVLVEQNRELEEANRVLLRQLSARTPPRSNIA